MESPPYKSSLGLRAGFVLGAAGTCAGAAGGAGVVADIKTFTAFGCFATAAISSVTFQNTTGVFGAVHQAA
ncbi:MAG: bifunctional hydroxymethylpyrimidine kinase/phosphomethylpyrimidine kinase, partial [Chthoniobacteraceae bacterium]